MTRKRPNMRKIDFCANWRGPPDPKIALNDPFLPPDRGLGMTVGGVNGSWRGLNGHLLPKKGCFWPKMAIFGQKLVIFNGRTFEHCAMCIKRGSTALKGRGGSKPNFRKKNCPGCSRPQKRFLRFDPPLPLICGNFYFFEAKGGCSNCCWWPAVVLDWRISSRFDV